MTNDKEIEQRNEKERKKKEKKKPSLPLTSTQPINKTNKDMKASSTNFLVQSKDQSNKFWRA